MKNFSEQIQSFHERGFFVWPLLIILVIAIPYLTPKTFNLIPNTQSFSYTAFDDALSGGSSEVFYDDLDTGGMGFSYILRKGEKWPYAGIHTDLIPDEVLVDLSTYDHLYLDVESEAEGNLQIRLRTFEEGITREPPSDSAMLLLFEKECRLITTGFECLGGRESFDVKIGDFTTEKWWINDYAADKKLGEPDMSKVYSLVIHSEGNAIRDHQYSFVIKSLRFERNLGSRFLKVFILIALYLALYGLLYYLATQKSASGKAGEEKSLFVPYERVEMESESESDLGRIAGYITKNYTDPNLSLVQVAAVVSLNKKRVSALLKERYQLSFKQYLNGLRLTEAKRLLEETDRRISEIATSVGYTNVTHFNRVFKSTEDISPKQYRTDKQG